MGARQRPGRADERHKSSAATYAKTKGSLECIARIADGTSKLIAPTAPPTMQIAQSQGRYARGIRTTQARQAATPISMSPNVRRADPAGSGAISPTMTAAGISGLLSFDQ